MKVFQGYCLLALVFCLSAVLTACGSSSPARFYTLAAITDLPAASPLAASVHVAPVTLPDMVDRPQLVVAVDRHQVHLLEGHRWAEPLKSAIPRILGDNLSRMLATDRVSWYPQNPAYRADYRITIDFRRFESSDRQVTVDTLWSINGAGGKQPATGRSLVSETLDGSGPEAVAAAYSRALATVSKEVAAAIRATAQTAMTEKKTP